MANRQLMLAVVLILLFWASRLLAIQSFPPFVDESFHINFARNAVERGPLAHASEGRQFTVWLYALVGSYHNAPFFSARTITLLMALPGLAAALAIGRMLAGLRGLLFVGLFFGFSLYHMFFERIALADPISASALLVAVYFAYRLTRRAAAVDALLCGLMLFVSLGAKISALPYVPLLPIAAVLALPPGRIRRPARLRWLLIAGGTVGILSVVYIAVLRWRGEDALFYLLRGTNEGGDLLALLLGRIPHNIGVMWANLSGFLTPAGLILMGAALIALLAWRRPFLPVLIILPVMIFWLNNRPDTRHYAIPMSLLLLAGALVMARVTQRRDLFIPALAGVLLWGGLGWLPFAINAARDPQALALPPADYAQYLALEASGSGLEAVADELRAREPAQVYGLLANCLSLYFMTLDALPVICPHINPNGATMDALADLLADAHPPGTYAVVEAIDYIPQAAGRTPVAVIERPAGGPALAIYRLGPG